MDFLQDLINVNTDTPIQIEYVINSKHYLIPEYKKTIHRFIKKKKNNNDNYNVKTNHNDICDLFIQQLVSK